MNKPGIIQILYIKAGDYTFLCIFIHDGKKCIMYNYKLSDKFEKSHNSEYAWKPGDTHPLLSKFLNQYYPIFQINIT